MDIEISTSYTYFSSFLSFTVCFSPVAGMTRTHLDHNLTSTQGAFSAGPTFVHAPAYLRKREREADGRPAASESPSSDSDMLIIRLSLNLVGRTRQVRECMGA